MRVTLRAPRLLVALALAGVLLPVAPASAQPEPRQSLPPVEVWGAFGAVGRTGAGSLDSAYRPEVAAAPDAERRASQSITIDPSTGHGFDAGVNVFPARHAGLQFFVSRTSADVGGVSTPYELELRYVSRPPPDNQPVPVTVTRSTVWPPASGRLTRWTWGAGPVFGWRTPRVAVTASGGLAWVRLSGDVEPLGYTAFRLGGHSVLFTEDYRVRVALGPSTVLAGFVAGALDLGLGPHLAATVGVRALLAGDADIASQVGSVTDTAGGLSPPLANEIDRVMALPAAEVSTRGLTFLVGLRIR